MKINRIYKETYSGCVYNFEVEDTHTYIANNIVVHNCHENSSIKGKHGDILNAEFIDQLHPYTELAIGGGNPLSHPDLIPFLIKCKELKLIPSMTVNQNHFMNNLEFIHELVDQELIYGLGVSLSEASEEFIANIQKFNNAVIHVINGLITISELDRLRDNHLKILILGYKEFRRGKQLYSDERKKNIIDKNKTKLANNLPIIVSENWFDVISFDNLALKQLNVNSILSKEDWDKFYMGDDGIDGDFNSATMYIDLVKKEFAKNSCSIIRYPLRSNAKEMYNFLRTSIEGDVKYIDDTKIAESFRAL